MSHSYDLRVKIANYLIEKLANAPSVQEQLSNLRLPRANMTEKEMAQLRNTARSDATRTRGTQIPGTTRGGSK